MNYKKYECVICGYIYDEELGDLRGDRFDRRRGAGGGDRVRAARVEEGRGGGGVQVVDDAAELLVRVGAGRVKDTEGADAVFYISR